MGSLDHGSWDRGPDSRAPGVPLCGTGRRVPEVPRSGLSGHPAYVSGVEGPERIAPAGRLSQGDSAILQGSIRARAEAAAQGADLGWVRWEPTDAAWIVRSKRSSTALGPFRRSPADWPRHARVVDRASARPRVSASARPHSPPRVACHESTGLSRRFRPPDGPYATGCGISVMNRAVVMAMATPCGVWAREPSPSLMPSRAASVDPLRSLRTLRAPPHSFDTPWGPSYHPPDDDAPCAFGRQARLRAFWGSDRPSPRPDGEDPGQSR